MKRTKELTNGQGVDVVYDAVGKDTYPGSLDCLKPLGLWVSFGNASGAITNFDPPAVGEGVALRHAADARHLHRQAGRPARQRGRAVRLGHQGIVKINVNHTYALKDAVQAHRDLEARKTTGSIVLVP